MQDGPAIYIEGLEKRYGEVRALKSLDLTVPKGSICGFLGPNGAGKTTAIKILLGLAAPDRGCVRILGLDALADSLRVRREVGYLAQSPTFYEHMTAREILRFVGRFYLEGPARALDRRVSEMLDLVDLSARADRPIGGFSGGEKQRLGIAQAAISRPPLLILDEPAAALDPMGRRRVLEIMEQLRGQTTIFYSTHILDDVQRVSDTVIILRDGEIQSQGPIEDLLGGGAPTYTVLATHPGGPRALKEIEAQLVQKQWVTGVETDISGNSVNWEIAVSDTDAADQELLRLIINEDETVVHSFGRRQHRLEEIFMELMSEEGGENR